MYNTIITFIYYILFGNPWYTHYVSMRDVYTVDLNQPVYSENFNTNNQCFRLQLRTNILRELIL